MNAKIPKLPESPRKLLLFQSIRYNSPASPGGGMVDVRPLRSMEVLLEYDICEAMGAIPPSASIRATGRHTRGVHVPYRSGMRRKLSPGGGMVDTYVSDAYAARHEGSSPFLGTNSI